MLRERGVFSLALLTRSRSAMTWPGSASPGAVEDREGLECACGQAVCFTDGSLDLGEDHQLGLRHVRRDLAR
jgi:hypothetical protein